MMELKASFNRPKAISCLATVGYVCGRIHEKKVSIARRRLVVLRPADLGVSRGDPAGFNRPKAISCLATPAEYARQWWADRVSIARRRLVVLRRIGRVIV